MTKTLRPEYFWFMSMTRPLKPDYFWFTSMTTTLKPDYFWSTYMTKTLGPDYYGLPSRTKTLEADCFGFTPMNKILIKKLCPLVALVMFFTRVTKYNKLHYNAHCVLCPVRWHYIFYNAVSNAIRRRGGYRAIIMKEGVDTVTYFGGNHGPRVWKSLKLKKVYFPRTRTSWDKYMFNRIVFFKF